MKDFFHLSEPLKELFDWASFTGAIAAFFKLVPEISGLVGLVWLCIRLWETETVKGWRNSDGNK